MVDEMIAAGFSSFYKVENNKRVLFTILQQNCTKQFRVAMHLL